MGWFQYDNGLRHERVKVLIHRLLLHWKYYILKDLLLFWKKQRAPDKNKFEKNFACILIEKLLLVSKFTLIQSDGMLILSNLTWI